MDKKMELGQIENRYDDGKFEINYIFYYFRRKWLKHSN